MQILQVRFKNLNSLVGEWEIDFTVPAFASEGIFAITGPTGAGKTTILDAICLALYGRTPRLDKVTQSGNEILSRQTGECFAEVTFENQKGRYRCHWSQRRALKKPNGQLQPPRHEIADARNGKVLATKIREVAERIEAITGMDFDRFTRSMLLAQGSFAAFLQADPDDRAPILEQITGTEIYSRISIRVHERRREENEKLQNLQAELEGMQLLDGEAEERLNRQLVEKSAQANELSLRVKRHEQALAWLEMLDCLKQEMARIEKQKEAWQQRNQAFEPQRQRLARANQALQLVGDYSTLTSLREEQEKDRQVLVERRETLPQTEAGVEEARERHRRAEARWQETKQALNDGLPILQKVRELDVKIRERGAPIDQLQNDLTGQERNLEMLAGKQQQDSMALAEKRQSLADLLNLIEASSADEALPGQLAGLKERFESLRQLQSQLTAKLKDIGQAEVEQTQATKTLQEKIQALQNHRQEQERLQKELTRLQETLGKTLEGRELAGWTTLSTGLAERQSQLERAVQTSQDLIENQKGLADLEQTRDKLQAERAEQAQRLESRIERRDALQREAGLLQEKTVLLDRIQSLEEARRQLRDGEPCPLCGATDHPYARGNVPVPDETRQRLEQVKTELKQIDDEVTGLKIRLAKLDKDLENNAADRQTHHRNIDEFRQALVETGRVLEVDLTGDDAGDILKTLQQENAARIDYARRVVEETGTLEKQIQSLRQHLEKGGIQLQEAENQAQAAGHRKETAAKQLERLGGERNDLQGRLDRLLYDLKAKLSPFGIDDLTLERLDDIEDRLTVRHDLWQARQREKGELEKDIATLETQVRHQEEQINGIHRDIDQSRKTLAGLIRERDTLKGERGRLFGDRDPQTEEKRLTAAVEAAEKELKSTQQRLSDADQTLEVLKTFIGELEKRLEVRKDKLLTREEGFHARLKGLGFGDEADFKKARLAEEERQSLEKQAQELRREFTELEAREKDVRKKLEDERRKKLTDHPRDEVESQRARLASEHQTLLEEIGAVRLQLEQNTQLKKQ